MIAVGLLGACGEDSDSSVPTIPGINAVIGGAWGTVNAVPEWPTNVDVTVENWSPPGLYVRAGGPGFYTEEVDGSSLWKWVTALVVGDAVADVHCAVCGT